jgi:hypothetical protein
MAQASWRKHRPIARRKKSRAQTMGALHKKDGSPPVAGRRLCRIRNLAVEPALAALLAALTGLLAALLLLTGLILPALLLLTGLVLAALLRVLRVVLFVRHRDVLRFEGLSSDGPLPDEATPERCGGSSSRPRDS